MHDWNVLYGLFEGSLSLMTQDVCRSERLKNCDLFNDSLNYRINPVCFQGCPQNKQQSDIHKGETTALNYACYIHL